MRSDVNPICQTANNYQVRMSRCQSANNFLTQFPAPLSCIACAYYTEYLGCIQITISFKEKNHRRIITLSEPERIIIIEVEICSDIVLCYIFSFLLSCLKIRSVAYILRQS